MSTIRVSIAAGTSRVAGVLAGEALRDAAAARSEAIEVEVRTADGILAPADGTAPAAGDRLLLHSDGFEAAFPEDQASRVNSQEPAPMHVQAFQQVLDVDSPAEIVKRLGERVDRAMMASANADDITLMVLRAG